MLVAPPGSQGTALLLAKASTPSQEAVVGRQVEERVGFFLRVDDFDAAYQRLQDAGVELLGAPRAEDYGRVVVFRVIAGNKWDLLGPR